MEAIVREFIRQERSRIIKERLNRDRLLHLFSGDRPLPPPKIYWCVKEGCKERVAAKWGRYRRCPEHRIEYEKTLGG